MIAVVTTDGRRDCIEQTIPSLLQHVGLDGTKLIVDDSGDAGYRAWLRKTFEPLEFEVIDHGRRRGQDVAVQLTAELIRDHEDPSEWVFWCEDDFLFERPVDLAAMVKVLERRPHLLQMALLRQPWFRGEVRAGGIIERDPDAYERCGEGEAEWLEHRLWFTLNPHVCRREMCSRSRLHGTNHEWRFSRALCEDPSVRFGIWGDGTPWIRHIGEHRNGHGY